MINQIRYFIGNSKCYTVRIVAYNSFVILYFLGQKLHASCLQGTFFSCFRKGGNIKEIYISIDNGETTCFLLSRCPIVNNVAIVGGGGPRGVDGIEIVFFRSERWLLLGEESGVDILLEMNKVMR